MLTGLGDLLESTSMLAEIISKKKADKKKLISKRGFRWGLGICYQGFVEL